MNKTTYYSDNYKLLLAEKFNNLTCKTNSILLISSIDYSSVLYSKLHNTHKTEVSEQSLHTIPEEKKYDVIILPDTLNRCKDVESLLEDIKKFSHTKTVLIIEIYNTLWRPLLAVPRSLGLANKKGGNNWLSRQDTKNLCELSGWEVFKTSCATLLPTPLPYILTPINILFNKWLAPLLPPFCLSTFLIARRKVERVSNKVSVIIPCRNEEGTIDEIVKRVPKLGKETELVFIEGGSKDNTW